MNQRSNITMTLAGALIAASLGQATAAEADPKGIDFFEKNIRPVLANNCYQCHSADARNLKGGLFLDSKQGILNGGDSGPVIVPGHPGESRLIEAIHHKGKLKMPPKRKLPERVIANFSEWIAMGAPDPRVANGGNPVKVKLTSRKAENFGPSFPQRKPSARCKERRLAKGEIDQFVLAKLEEKKLTVTRDATEGN